MDIWRKDFEFYNNQIYVQWSWNFQHVKLHSKHSSMLRQGLRYTLAFTCIGIIEEPDQPWAPRNKTNPWPKSTNLKWSRQDIQLPKQVLKPAGTSTSCTHIRKVSGSADFTCAWRRHTLMSPEIEALWSLSPSRIRGIMYSLLSGHGDPSSPA